MPITHESADQLSIHCAGRGRRGTFAAMLGVGVFLCGAAVFAFVMGFLGQFPTPDAFSMAGFMAIIGIMFGIGGWFGLRSARDVDYHFDAKAHCLIIRWRTGEKRIPFSRILKADVINEGANRAAYVVRLKLRDSLQDFRLDDWWLQDNIALQALAEKVNQVVRAHEPHSIDLTDAGFATMATQFLANLWRGTPRPRRPAGPKAVDESSPDVPDSRIAHAPDDRVRDQNTQ